MDVGSVKWCALHSLEHLLKLGMIFWTKVVWTHSARKRETKGTGEEKGDVHFKPSTQKASLFRRKGGRELVRDLYRPRISTSLPSPIKIVSLEKGKSKYDKSSCTALDKAFRGTLKWVVLLFLLRTFKRNRALTSGFSKCSTSLPQTKTMKLKVMVQINSYIKYI